MSEIETQEQLMQTVISERNVSFLTDLYFNIQLVPGQVDIVGGIAFPENKRMVISCMTRYGKSFSVAIGVLLYVLFHKGKRIRLIAPQIEQANVIRNYLSEFILRSDIFMDLVDLQLSGIDRLKAEVSKKRITFKNGCEIMVLSAEGDANRLMGHGGDLLIIDEDCLIKYDVYRTKISRMLGDNPDSILVSIGNPWHRNNQMYEHWTDPDYIKIHIDYKQALREGRISEEFVEEQRKLLTPIEFEILYGANFPEEAEDSVFKYSEVLNATKLKKGELIHRRIISCDVADKGVDRTVIMEGIEADGIHTVQDVFSEAKSENMQVVGHIVRKANIHLANDTKRKEKDSKWKRPKIYLNIDTIGVGIGVVSRLREVYKGNKWVVVVACHYGEGVGAAGQERQERSQTIQDRRSSSERKRFMNRKAQQFFRLKDLFEGEQMRIPEHKQLITELMKMRWETTSSGKIRILDPEEKSPDFADALVYFIWKSKKEVKLNLG